MTVIPSLILSAALSCGSGVPEEAWDLISASEGCAADSNIICAGDMQDICDVLAKFGVDLPDCPAADFLRDYICGSGDRSEPEAPAEPEEPATPKPVPTKAPAEPEEPATPKPVPTKAPAAEPPYVTDDSTSSYARQVVDLVNQERAKRSLPALTIDNTLMSAALTRAAETVKSFSHTRPNGSSFSSVLSEYNYGYRTAGENSAYGQRTPQEVVTAWMNSSGHRANILNGNYTKIGVGCYKSGGTYYWSQLFAG